MPELIISVEADPMKKEFMKKGMVMSDKGELREPKKKVLKPGQDIETDEMYELEEYIPILERFLKALKKNCGTDEKMTEEKDVQEEKA